MSLHRTILLTALAFLAAFAPAAAQAPAQPPIREITKIAGEVYRFRNAGHFSVFAVTPAGIIVTDPINADAARWLKAELQRRFNQPVRYLVYSHDHSDHSSGGEIFADTAVVVGHENTKRTMIAEKRPTAVPQVTFSDTMTIELGGTVLELSYLGKNHSDNSILMRFPRERVAFAVDWIPVKGMSFRDWPDAYIHDWVEGLKRVEAMDFDILAPGHGPMGVKADVAAFRIYVEELRDLVLPMLRDGKPVAEVVAAARERLGPKYSGWGGYEQMFNLNVEGMYRYLANYRRPN